MAEELAFARLLLCAGLNVSARSVPCRQSSRRFPRQPRSRLKSEEGERSVAAFFFTQTEIAVQGSIIIPGFVLKGLRHVIL